jgi:aryl-alcohol dehydrogenase-like predicted oxidoreductase
LTPALLSQWYSCVAFRKDFCAMQHRPFGSTINSDRLPQTVSVIGLGCSSFSTFFWSDQSSVIDEFSPVNLSRGNEQVKEWIRAVRFAICDAGITLLDTAPWYGHGTSEIVVGWAIEELSNDSTISFNREAIAINTKVGRYERNPSRQFDYSRSSTLDSVDLSLKRLNCEYINVLQLHDPEFAPSLQQLLDETIPTMLECRQAGKCRALGMTGYPLEVQYQILQASLDRFGPDCWDQALTYSHFNLHDRTLFSQPLLGSTSSFATYCRERNILLLAAYVLCRIIGLSQLSI